jgi:two-component system sensor histidine kinase UhpB
MRVRDWGKGFNVEQALAGVAGDKHLGLMGMSERISLVGGALEISSAPGQGSVLTARLSVPA